MNDSNLSIKYAFTITLKPKFYVLEPCKQFDSSVEYLWDKLKSVMSKVTLVAELTQNFNIHYHGVGVFTISNKRKNLMLQFVNTFRKDSLIGFVNIKPISDEPGWIEYLSKGFQNFYDSLSRRPIINDECEIFTTACTTLYGSTW